MKPLISLQLFFQEKGRANWSKPSKRKIISFQEATQSTDENCLERSTLTVLQ
jgi:hypothetical protein